MSIWQKTIYNEKEFGEIHKKLQDKLNNSCQFEKEKNYVFRRHSLKWIILLALS